MTETAPTLEARVAAVRRYLAGTLRRTGILAGFTLVAVLLGAAWLLSTPDGWRPGSPAPLVIDALALAALAAGTLWWVAEMRRRSSEEVVGRTIEGAAGLADGELRGALELGREAPAGVSGALIARGERRLLERLRGDAAALAGEGGEWARTMLTRSAWLAAVSGAIVATLGAVDVSRTAAAWGGLLTPARVLEGPELPPVTVSPGTVELPRGASVGVSVQAPMRTEVTLVWQAAGDVVRRERLPVEGERASYTFSSVTAEVSYHVEAPDGARSPTFSLLPVDPLFVTDVALRLRFPPHTGRVDEEYRGDIPPLRLPAGTRVEVQGRGNRILGAAELLPDSGPPSPETRFTIDGTAFRGTWTPRRSGVRRWRFLDVDGAEARTVPPPLELEIVPDAAPRVVILEPVRDTVLSLGLRQPLVVQAADDHGVAWLELVAWRVTALGEARPPVTQRIDAGARPRVLVRPVMDVSGWELLPGDEVRYFVRVRDNAPSGQEARTPEHVLRVPDAQDLRREAGRELDEAARTLEALQAEAREAAEEAREARRRADAPARDAQGGDPAGTPDSGDVDFSQREELRGALEEQEARARQVDSLRQALSEMSASLAEAGAQDSRLRSDLEELQSLLDELGGEALQEELRDMMAGLEEMDPGEARRTMEEMARRQEDLEARLDEAVERMRRAAARQDFATTTQEAEDLARRQEALARDLAQEPTQERAARQEALADEAAALEERMEGLARRLDELGEAEAARGVDEARQGAQEARQGMQEAARQAQAGQGEAAGRQGQQAAQQMDDAAREMMQAREEMMRERAEALQRALRQTTQDALALARRQAELRERMVGADAGTLSDLRGAVAAVEQGTANSARNLALAARAARAGGGEREISTTLGAALGELEETVAALDNPSAPGVPSPQVSAGRAVERLNDAARQALAAAQALSQGGQGQPTPQEAMEQLQELAQEQADVNNQASQLMPMELTPQSMQQQMEQLAQQQQQVASNVGQLSDQEGDGPLGDLEALAQEAEALARQLEQGRLDATTRERQERLFHRLLDAGRSLEKEEESTERESETPGVVEPGSILPLDSEALGILRFRPDGEALRRLSPAARALVIRYFQRLNEGRGGAP